MSEEENTQQEEQAAPEMIVDYEAECPSITGRSTLTFQAGRMPDQENPVPHLRIAANSGKGMACLDWAPIALIDAVIAKAGSVTARTFDEVHPGKSINTGGFILAIVKDLGVVQPKNDNTRHHERVAGATVLQALSKRIAEASAADGASKTRRKGKAE